MLRILLVDDEKEILDWLRELFTEQQRVPMEVYTAVSGSAALKILNTLRIDIVLSDIRMPGMTGLQLMQRIRCAWPDCRILFLTGYSEFDYIYSALRQEGVGYLLKTEDDSVILESVSRVAEEIETSMQAIANKRLLSSVLERARPHLKREYLLHCLAGETPEQMPSLSVQDDSLNKELDLSLSISQPVLLLSGRLDTLFLPNGICLADPRLELLQSCAGEWLGKRFHLECLLGEKQEVLWLLQPKEEAFPLGEDVLQMEDRRDILSSVLPAVLESTLDSLQTYVHKQMSTTVSFVYCTTAFSWDQLSSGYSMIRHLFLRMTGLGTQVILNEKSLETGSFLSECVHENTICHPDGKRQARIDSFSQLLDRGEEASCVNILSAMTQGFASCQSHHDPHVIELYFQISTMLLSFINRHKLIPQVSFHLGTAPLTRVDLHENWAKAAQYLEDMTRCVISLTRQQGRDLMQSSVQNVCDYIQNHVHEDLSLMKLAEISWFNPSYLSRLFRQSTGQTLSEFIALARLEKAKTMLRDPSFRVLDVASAVGFESSHSFARFFRKVTGLSPMEFREHIKAESKGI